MKGSLNERRGRDGGEAATSKRARTHRLLNAVKVTRGGSPIAWTAQWERLRDVIAIAELLLPVRDLDVTFDPVMHIVAGTLSLRGAAIVRGADARTTLWSASSREATLRASMEIAARRAYAACAAVRGRVSATSVVNLGIDRGPFRPFFDAGALAVPLVDDGALVGLLYIVPNGRFGERDRTFVDAVAHAFALALGRDATLRRHLAAQPDAGDGARETENQRLRADIAAMLGHWVDERVVLSRIAHRLVPSLGDVCIVDLIDADGTLHPCAVLVDDVHGAGAEAVRRYVETRDLHVNAVDTASNANAQIDAGGALGSRIVVSIRARGRAFGLVTLARLEGRGAFDVHDRELVEDVFDRVALAIDDARMFQEARRVAAERERILAIVSHDLRTPLSAIRIAVDAAMDACKAKTHAECMRCLSVVKRSATRMERMIRDLVDVARVDSGQLSITVSVESIASICNEASEAVAHLAGAKSIVEHLVVPADVRVFCDRDRIVQVLVNLLGNAIKFTAPHMRIVIRATAAGDEVRVEVEDEGVGIAPEALPHVFERGWQAAETARLGLGLGLYICKAIVELHGGHIDVRSEPGRGSTFGFTLPRAP